MKLSPGGNIEIQVDENIIIISPIRKNYTQSFKGTVKGKQAFEELENLCAIDRENPLSVRSPEAFWKKK